MKSMVVLVVQEVAVLIVVVICVVETAAVPLVPTHLVEAALSDSYVRSIVAGRL